METLDIVPDMAHEGLNLNNLTRIFQTCHLCTFNACGILWGGGHPAYDILPYAMILISYTIEIRVFHHQERRLNCEPQLEQAFDLVEGAQE